MNCNYLEIGMNYDESTLAHFVMCACHITRSPLSFLSLQFVILQGCQICFWEKAWDCCNVDLSRPRFTFYSGWRLTEAQINNNNTEMCREDCTKQLVKCIGCNEEKKLYAMLFIWKRLTKTNRIYILYASHPFRIMRVDQVTIILEVGGHRGLC